MKTRNIIANKAGYIGAGIGLLLFALVGLLQGSMIGGVIGMVLVNSVFGEPVGATLLSRVIVGGSMLTGVVVAGIISLTVCSASAYAVGYVVGMIKEPAAETAAATQKSEV